MGDVTYGPSGEVLPAEEMDTPEGIAAKKSQMMGALAQKLQTKVDLRITQKKNVEQRWLMDLRQYHGKYEPDKVKRIREAGGSEDFVNITRSKTNTFSARVADMLLPSDDKNWGIEPTPVPKLEAAVSNKTVLTDPATGQPAVTPEGNEIQARDMAQGVMQVAEERCASMEREIDDQLEEAGYNGVQRDVIADMALYGTGILKGPILTNSTKKKWNRVDDGQGNVQYQLSIEQETKPGCERVSPWNFFPDMTVADMKQCEDFLERHPMTRSDLVELAKLPGFDKDVIRDLLKAGPQKTTLWFLNELRSISEQELAQTQNTLWEVWEFTGPVTRDELEACGCEGLPDDELLLMEAVIWWCDGEILKATLNSMDSGDRPYSVCYCEKDDTSIFGFGYPYLLRAPQGAACGSWRMLFDNSGLSVGPQVIINRRKVSPMDNDWKLKPRKVWELTEDGVDPKTVFYTVAIDSHQEELVNLFKLACAQADVETNLPLIAQGMDSPDQPDTATGLSIQHNNSSVVLRRSVKSYDDDITRTFIPRMYDWNMQFNPKDEIKGDYKVIAKGAGVLLEKERMAQTIMSAMQVITKDPEAGVKINKGKLYDQWFRAMRLDDVMNTADEEQKARDDLAKQQQQAAQQTQQGKGAGPAQPLGKNDPQYLAQDLDLRERELQFLEQKHQDEMSLEVRKIASALDMDEKDLQAKIGLSRMGMDHKSRLFNAEASLRQTTGAGVGIT